MEAKTNYFIVGISVLLLSTMLLIGGLWLSVGFDEKHYNTYIVDMNEAVSGLNDESPVKYNGVKVGYISDIDLNKQNPQQVRLLIHVEAGTPITQSTTATLIAQGITGTTYLGLSAQSNSMVLLRKKPGEPYPVIPYEPSFFNQLESHVKVIQKNEANVNKSLEALPELIRELKISVTEFNLMSKDVAAAGRMLSSTMKAGRNSIDKISQQAIPPAVSLLRRLELIAANLEKVSADMRQNPAVIIRGSAPAQSGPGE